MTRGYQSPTFCAGPVTESGYAGLVETPAPCRAGFPSARASQPIRRQRAYYPAGGNCPALPCPPGVRGLAATVGFRPRLHFQGPTTARGTPQEPRRSTLPRPYRLANSFQGHGGLNRKENSPPDRRQRMQGHSRYRDRYTLTLPEDTLGDVISGTRFWNKYQIPFRLQICNG